MDDPAGVAVDVVGGVAEVLPEAEISQPVALTDARLSSP